MSTSVDLLRGVSMEKTHAIPMPDAGIRGWLVNEARQQYWRVKTWYEFDDLVQDGYMIYSKCYARYYHTYTKDHNRQLMAIVQVSFKNYVHTLTQRRGVTTELPFSQVLPAAAEADALERLMPAEEELGTITVLINNAPAEIAEVITALLQDATGFLRKRAFRRAIRETTNEYFCRLVGKDPLTNDLRGKVQAYFRL